MELQEQIHLKGRVWSRVSYSLEECFDAGSFCRLLQKELFHHKFKERPLLEPLLHQGRRSGRSPFCTSRQARQQTRDVSWILLQLDGRLRYLQPGLGHLRWAPLCQSIQDPAAESALIFQYTTVWARMEHLSTDFSNQLLSIHSLTDCSNLIL